MYTKKVAPDVYKGRKNWSHPIYLAAVNDILYDAKEYRALYAGIKFPSGRMREASKKLYETLYLRRGSKTFDGAKRQALGPYRKSPGLNGVVDQIFQYFKSDHIVFFKDLDDALKGVPDPSTRNRSYRMIAGRARMPIIEFGIRGRWYIGSRATLRCQAIEMCFKAAEAWKNNFKELWSTKGKEPLNSVRFASDLQSNWDKFGQALLKSRRICIECGSDGNCLFKSISVALASLAPGYDVYTANYLNIQYGKYSGKVIDGDLQGHETLRRLAILALGSNGDLIRRLKEAGIDPEHEKRLLKIPNSYAGETALVALASELQVRFLIWTMRKDGTLDWHAIVPTDDGSSLPWINLAYMDTHYRAISNSTTENNYRFIECDLDSNLYVITRISDTPAHDREFLAVVTGMTRERVAPEMSRIVRLLNLRNAKNPITIVLSCFRDSEESNYPMSIESFGQVRVVSVKAKEWTLRSILNQYKPDALADVVVSYPGTTPLNMTNWETEVVACLKKNGEAYVEQTEEFVPRQVGKITDPTRRLGAPGPTPPAGAAAHSLRHTIMDSSVGNPLMATPSTPVGTESSGSNSELYDSTLIDAFANHDRMFADDAARWWLFHYDGWAVSTVKMNHEVDNAGLSVMSPVYRNVMLPALLAHHRALWCPDTASRDKQFADLVELFTHYAVTRSAASDGAVDTLDDSIEEHQQIKLRMAKMVGAFVDLNAEQILCTSMELPNKFAFILKRNRAPTRRDFGLPEQSASREEEAPSSLAFTFGPRSYGKTRRDRPEVGRRYPSTQPPRRRLVDLMRSLMDATSDDGKTQRLLRAMAVVDDQEGAITTAMRAYVRTEHGHESLCVAQNYTETTPRFAAARATVIEAVRHLWSKKSRQAALKRFHGGAATPPQPSAELVVAGAMAEDEQLVEWEADAMIVRARMFAPAMIAAGAIIAHQRYTANYSDPRGLTTAKTQFNSAVSAIAGELNKQRH